MLNKRGLVTAGLCCCVSVLGWAHYAEAATKVTICHKADSVKYFEISVAASAVPAHLAHGDCVVDDGVACTTDSCDAKLGCVHVPNNGACDDGNACTSDSCNPASGCQYADNIVCGDGVVCGPEECESDADCPDGAACENCTCGSGPDPECSGQTCSTFTSCNPNSNCQFPVCGSTAEGGGLCVEGATPCAGLAPCSSSAECTPGLCFVNSCCGSGVCVPPEAFCPEAAGAAASVPSVPKPAQGPTFGGQ